MSRMVSKPRGRLREGEVDMALSSLMKARCAARGDPSLLPAEKALCAVNASETLINYRR